MAHIRVAKWLIRITVLCAFVGIVVIALCCDVGGAARISGVGACLQIAGSALALPELVRRLSSMPADDLIIWAETFMPLWKILSRMRLARSLERLSVVLAITGVAMIFTGLGLQYLSSYL